MTALEKVFGEFSLSLDSVIADAFNYFRQCLQADGSITENPDIVVFQEWDSVNALKALALWRDACDTVAAADTADAIIGFLRAREKSSGMLSWGATEIGADEYCTETSSEYVSALALLGRDEAAPRAEFLRTRQRAEGPWAEVHSHIPKAFQLESSVTGFALCAMEDAGIEPLHLDAALDFLAEKQAPDGQFGINWYYYCTHYYLMRPAVAALATFGNFAAVAKARDFTLGRQRADGSWMSQVEAFDGPPAAPELQSALALSTLAHAGMSAEEAPVRRALEWLLRQRRPDGSWSGGRYPYPETESYAAFRATQDVYTTAQVLAAFKYLEQQ